MDKLFVDINVVLDVVLNREIEESSLIIMNTIDRRQAQGFLSAVSCATIYYLSRKKFSHGQALRVIKDLMDVFQVVTVDDKALNLALDEQGPDYEDNIQIVCARLAKADYIITRDLPHFKHAHIPVLSPYQYLRLKH